MYHIEVVNQGAYAFEAKAKNYRFSIEMEGKAGITPLDTLLASLGSCVGVYIRKYCEGAKISLNEFSIDVSADLAREKPASFRKINVTIDLKGPAFSEVKRKALLDFVRNCPVHTTLGVEPQVEIAIK